MGYRIIEAIDKYGDKKIRWRSTGHNGGDDRHKRERKKKIAQARFEQSKRPRHLGKAGQS